MNFFQLASIKLCTYSCGIFEKPDQELENAQINKYNKLINFLIAPKSFYKICELDVDGQVVCRTYSKNYDIQLDQHYNFKKQFEYKKKETSSWFERQELD